MLYPVVAGEGQVVCRIRPAMLTGDDVVNRKGRKGLVSLRQTAIFTPVACAFAYQSACCRINHAGSCWSNRRALA